MVGFLIRRIGQAIFVLFLVTAATLGLVHLFPGGPVRALLGVRATPFLINYYNNLYGFNQPFYEQYIKWVDQLLHGNLGFSDKLNLSVGQPHRPGPAEDDPPGAARHLRRRCCSASRSASTRRCSRNSVADYVLTGDLLPRLLDPDVLPRPRAGRLVRGRRAPVPAVRAAVVLGARSWGTRRRWSCRCSPTRSCSTRSGPGTCARPCSTTWCRTTCAPPGPRAPASAG